MSAFGNLAIGPDFDFSVPEMRAAVSWLERRVRDKRIRIGCLNLLGCVLQPCVYVSYFLESVLRRSLGQFFGTPSEIRTALPRTGTLIPLDIQLLAGGLRRPPGIG